ncbi:MAG: uroporphyrinogen-III synthase [Burkholderia sp.]|nr:uroporphyrinogen-III synthase [Burkholderia sp.]
MHVANTHAFTIILTQSRNCLQYRVFAEQIVASGYTVLDFPLIDISAADDPIPITTAFRSLNKYELSIFMSPNAINYTFASHNVIWPIDLSIGVVGPGSIAALARYGIAKPLHHIISPSLSSNGNTPEYDSEHLYDAINKAYRKGASTLSGKRILIFRGDSGREWLENRLRDAGANILVVTAYRRTIPMPCIKTWERVHRILQGVPHAWFITSSGSLQNLNKLTQANLTKSDLVLLKHSPIITPHPRIEKTARALGFNQIILIKSQDMKYIVRALRDR